MNTMNAKQLKDHLQRQDPPLLLDVLPQESFRQEHIPGAANVPVKREDFLSSVEGIAGNKSREVVVYCASKDCDASPTAARKLEEAGFENVTDFEGGLADWKQAGYAVEGAAATS
jgi:rhodanese-related sulfurtransferase